MALGHGKRNSQLGNTTELGHTRSQRDEIARRMLCAQQHTTSRTTERGATSSIITLMHHVTAVRVACCSYLLPAASLPTTHRPGSHASPFVTVSLDDIARFAAV